MSDYLKFWGIPQAVFHRALPYGRIFISLPRQRELQRLLQLAQQVKTLQLVTAAAGCGKSTLAHWLFSSLDPMTHEGYLGGVQGERGLLAGLNQFLVGREHLDGSLWRAFAKGIEQLTEEKRQLVVIVDVGLGEEASVLADIHGMFDVCARANAALACVLVADPSLAGSLAGHIPLRQRLAFQWHMPAFNREESEQYVQWYVHQAGMAHSPFDAAAMDALASHCQGVAARMNSLGENCFIEAAFREIHNIDRTMVDSMAALSSWEGARSLLQAIPQSTPQATTEEAHRLELHGNEMPLEALQQSSNAAPLSDRKTEEGGEKEEAAAKFRSDLFKES